MVKYFLAIKQFNYKTMLEKQIAEDFVQALKSKDENATSVLRMLKSALQNKKLKRN